MKRAVFVLMSANLWAMAVLAGEAEDILKKFDTLKKFHIPSAVEYGVYDPFKRAAPLVKRSGGGFAAHRRPAPIRLTAILNDMAFINGRWVRTGEYVGRYRIVRIGGTGVVLKSGNLTRIVPLGKRKRILKIEENL